MKNLFFKINWLWVVIIILGLNLFAVSFFYSAHKVKEIRMTRISFENAISRIIEPFPRKGKRNFYVEMRNKRDELLPRYENIMAQRSIIINIIAEDELNVDKLEDALQVYTNMYLNMHIPVYEVMISTLEGLNVEERKTILNNFENRPKRNGRNRNDVRHLGGPPRNRNRSSSGSN
jgi:hypothetical protein